MTNNTVLMPYLVVIENIASATKLTQRINDMYDTGYKLVTATVSNGCYTLFFERIKL